MGYAHRIVSKAIKSQELVRPEECEKCGKVRKLIAHHTDYSKPLDVEWLCRSCHGIEHAKNGTSGVDSQIRLTPEELKLEQWQQHSAMPVSIVGLVNFIISKWDGNAIISEPVRKKSRA